MYIIQFILIVFLIGFAIVAITIWRAWRKIHKAVNQFNDQLNGTAGQQSGSAQPHSTTTTDSGDTIVDTRSPEQANQKIFGKDEGEYVDYEVRE